MPTESQLTPFEKKYVGKKEDQRKIRHGELPLKPFDKVKEEGLRTRIDTVIRPSTESVKLLQERVIGPIKGLATKWGIKIMTAGDDYLYPHVALQPVDLVNYHPTDVTDEFSNLAQSSSIATLKEQIEKNPLKITFDSFVPEGRDGFICTLDDQEAIETVLKLRTDLISVIAPEYEVSEYAGTVQPQKADGTDPKKIVSPYNDIVHLTIFRITELPDDPEDLASFYKDVQKLHRGILANPLTLEFNDLFVGSAYELWDTDEKLNMLREPHSRKLIDRIEERQAS